MHRSLLRRFFTLPKRLAKYFEIDIPIITLEDASLTMKFNEKCLSNWTSTSRDVVITNSAEGCTLTFLSHVNYINCSCNKFLCICWQWRRTGRRECGVDTLLPMADHTVPISIGSIGALDSDLLSTAPHCASDCLSNLNLMNATTSILSKVMKLQGRPGSSMVYQWNILIETTQYASIGSILM